jgi:hypothetical protein
VVVYLDTELGVGVAQLDLDRPAQVTIGEIAVAKRQAVDVVVRLVIVAAVVEEATDHAARAAVLVNHQQQTLELPDGIETLRPHGVCAVLRQPNVHVSGAPFGPIDSELNIGDPTLVVHWSFRPHSAALVAWRRRREDELVGEDLRDVGAALESEVGHRVGSLGSYPVGS